MHKAATVVAAAVWPVGCRTTIAILAIHHSWPTCGWTHLLLKLERLREDVKPIVHLASISTCRKAAVLTATHIVRLAMHHHIQTA
jgi:hypothetical protein